MSRYHVSSVVAKVLSGAKTAPIVLGLEMKVTTYDFLKALSNIADLADFDMAVEEDEDGKLVGISIGELGWLYDTMGPDAEVWRDVDPSKAGLH